MNISSVLQHKLEGALLALGQFQHALDELLAWMTHTEELLSGQKKTSGDPKAIEIELAKHHVSSLKNKKKPTLYTVYLYVINYTYIACLWNDLTVINEQKFKIICPQSQSLFTFFAMKSAFILNKLVVI